MGMRTRTGMDAIKFGKWRFKRPNFDTLDDAGEWGRQTYATAAQIAAGVTKARCFGYTRVSTNDQADNGFSLAAQSDQILEHFASRVNVKHPHLEWGEMLVDPGVSAYKKPFLLRPAGSRLNALLKPGDHVIFAKMDRAFRQGADYFRMSEVWSKRGIVVHYIDPDVDGSTTMGWVMLGMMAIWAEMFSRMLSERTKAGIAKKKELGHTMYRKNQPDIGKKAVYSYSKGFFIDVPADPEYWDKLAKAAELMCAYGMTEATDRFQDWLFRDVAGYKRPPRSRYEFSACQVMRMAARHVGILTKDPRKYTIGDIRQRYAEMQSANASACKELSDSVSL